MEESKFIDCALQQKYITLIDIEECREIQRSHPSLTMEQIFKLHGFLDEAKCNVIHALLKYKNEDNKPRLLTSVKRKKDKAFANVALKEKLIDSKQLLKLIELQKKLEGEGQKYPLINVVIAKNYLWANGSWENWYDETFATGQNTEILFFVTKGEAQGSTFIINKKDISISLVGKTEWSIGRFPSNQIVIPESTISRIHCKFHFELDHWKIVDMMSSSGVFVNGEKTKRKVLAYGDEIVVASKKFIVKLN